MKKDNFKSFFIMTVIVSFLVGSISGGVFGIIFANQFLSDGQAFQILPGGRTVKKEFLTERELELESATIKVVEQASPAVVSVIVTKKITTVFPRSPFDDFFFNFPGFRFEFPLPRLPKEPQQVGAGTGFLVSADGLIVTNRHVVADSEASYTVLTNDGKKHKAKVLARDPVLDLAIVKIETEGQNYQALALGDSDKVKIGQTVIAIGNALGEFRNTVTRGVISGIGRTITAEGSRGGAEVIEQAIQTDAAISPGNSGGPLINLQGEVIGVNTAVSLRGENIGFALPINEAKRIIESVKKFGRIIRPFLGVRYILLNEKISQANDLPVDYGALLVGGATEDEPAVVPDSPAERAGLKENDIILEVDGQRVDQAHSLARLLARHKPGDEVKLKILRDKRELELSAVLEEFKEE